MTARHLRLTKLDVALIGSAEQGSVRLEIGVAAGSNKLPPGREGARGNSADDLEVVRAQGRVGLHGDEWASLESPTPVGGGRVERVGKLAGQAVQGPGRLEIIGMHAQEELVRYDGPCGPFAHAQVGLPDYPSAEIDWMNPPAKDRSGNTID